MWRLTFAACVVVLISSLAIADNQSDRQSLLAEIDGKLGAAAAELSGAKSDTDDGDLRDAEGYVDQVRELVSRLDRVKDDDGRAGEVVASYPAYVDRFKRVNAALRGMKGYQRSNVSLMKICADKDAELVAMARDFESRGDPDGLERLPRAAAEAKHLTVRFLDDAEKFRTQMADWRRTVHYFDVDDGRWRDVRAELHRDADEIDDFFEHDHDTAKERCEDLTAGPEHPVVKEVLGKLANSAAGRKEVTENLLRLIGELAAKISDVAGASGTYAVDGVVEKLDAIDASLAILDRSRGADPRAKEIAERWPAIARAARASIDPLRQLKTHHHDMDALPGRCRELEAKLDGVIATNGDAAEGIDAIPAFAIGLGNPVTVGVAKAKALPRDDRRPRDLGDVAAAAHGRAAARRARPRRLQDDHGMADAGRLPRPAVLARHPRAASLAVAPHDPEPR